ncbi:MAG: O-antigen ligase family protein [Acidobacteriota bacterium]|nr:O-antigen ligase family protein [Acidobacteriota bacterium]
MTETLQADAQVPLGSTSLSDSGATSLLSLALSILVIVVYANASDLAIRDFSLPSILQPLIALLALVVWAYRVTLRPSQVFLQPLTLLLALYCFVLFASSLWASDVGLTDLRLAEALKSFAIYLLIGSLAFTWIGLRRAFAALSMTAALLGFLTIVQTVTGTRNEFGGLAQLKIGNVYGDVDMARASGPVDDPNFYAQLLLIVLPLAVFLATTERHRFRKIVYAAAALLIAAGTVLTYSRGGIVALGLMLVLFTIAIRMRPAFLLAAVAIAIAALAVMPAGVVRRTLSVREVLSSNTAGGPEDASIEERKLFLGAAWQMFNDHPILGVGAGNFATYFNRYALIVGSPAVQYHDRGDPAFPHMLYLQIAAETGVVGLLCFLAAVSAAFLSLRRSHEMLAERVGITTALAIALAGYLITALFLHGAYQRNFWILLGFVAAIARLPRREVAL